MNAEIHPSPSEATEQELLTDPILRFFRYEHLPPGLKTRSEPFCTLALKLVRSTQRGPERTVALRKLLEAKDAAVRAAI